MSDDEPNAAIRLRKEILRRQEKLRLRAPKQDGQTLVVPPLRDAETLWQAFQSTTLPSQAKGAQAKDAQAEIVEAAVKYTRSYSDFGTVDATAPVIMSGHQPSLFHCGVWFKNFVLSSFAQRFNATAINLVVDNDLSSGHSIMYPTVVERDESHIIRAELNHIAIDEPGAAVPFELREIQSAELFSSFANRMHDSISPIVDDPLVHQLWSHVMQLRGQGENRFGHAIAAGRHRLEQSIGLKTLELPISLMSKTQAFAQFVSQIVHRRHDLWKIYNESLQEYRQANSIRSASHPVPSLEYDDHSVEVPFWIWTQDAPRRKRLFIKGEGANLTLTDRDQWSETISSDLANWIVENSDRVSIRPRALTNTMFCRAFCGNLFLHGIGGAKYDQLTDVIIEKFYSFSPPPILTATATMHLPAGFHLINKSQKAEPNVKLRNLKFHPEKHLSNSTDLEILSLIQRKKGLVSQARLPNNRKQRHDEIESLNQELQPFLESKRNGINSQKQFIDNHWRTSQILSSREFSFAMFPESIIEKLIQSAKQ